MSHLDGINQQNILNRVKGQVIGPSRFDPLSHVVELDATDFLDMLTEIRELQAANTWLISARDSLLENIHSLETKLSRERQTRPQGCYQVRMTQGDALLQMNLKFVEHHPDGNVILTVDDTAVKLASVN